MRAVKQCDSNEKLESRFSKKRINICNHQPSQHSKRRQSYDKQQKLF